MNREFSEKSGIYNSVYNIIVFMGCNLTCIRVFSFFKVLFFINFTFIVNRVLLCHLKDRLTS